MSADEMRDLLAYATAYAPVADDLEAMAQMVRHSVIAARNCVGAEVPRYEVPLPIRDQRRPAVISSPGPALCG